MKTGKMEDGENSGRKRQKRGDDAIPLVDRIGSLPEGLICQILSCLPPKSAAATSVLSKSWRFRWTKVTSFDFDDRFWPNSKRSDSRKPGDGSREMNFADYVNTVLRNHDAEVSIRRFHLTMKNRKFPLINTKTWVETAITKNIRVLVLDLVPLNVYFSDDDYLEECCPALSVELPDSLYTCGTLEILKLRGGFVVNAPHVVRLPYLTHLELISVSYKFRAGSECIPNLVAGSPKLQSLVIHRHHYDCFMVCRISSPVLKRFQYVHNLCWRCDFIPEKNYKLELDAPALEYLYLDDVDSKDIVFVRGLNALNKVDLVRAHFRQPRKILSLVEAFDSVKNLTLSTSGAFGYFSYAAKKLPTSFYKLIKLVLRFDCFQFSCLMNLIDCCVTLKVIQIELEYDEDHYARLENSSWRDPTSVPKCFSSSLTQVSYWGFQGHESEMDMLKFIMAHASVMTKLDIRCGDYCPYLDEDFEEKLVSSALALAPTCKISVS